MAGDDKDIHRREKDGRETDRNVPGRRIGQVGRGYSNVGRQLKNKGKRKFVQVFV